jgi:hypothetical protein
MPIGLLACSAPLLTLCAAGRIAAPRASSAPLTPHVDYHPRLVSDAFPSIAKLARPDGEVPLAEGAGDLPQRGAADGGGDAGDSRQRDTLRPLGNVAASERRSPCPS